MKRIVSALAISTLLACSLPTWADLPANPRLPKIFQPKRARNVDEWLARPTHTVGLERNPKCQLVRILLPQDLLETASIQQQDTTEDYALEARTWVAGAALSLAMAVAGLWLLRYRSQPRRALRFAAVLGVSLTLIGCELLSMFRGEVEAAPERELLAQGTASVEKSDNDAVRIIFPAALANRIDPLEEKSK